MTKSVRTRVVSAAVVLAVLTSSCSGEGGRADVASPDNPANAPIEQIDEGSGGVATPGPISGLVTVQLSFGFGVYVVDDSTGQAVALPGIASVETVDRNRDVIVSGNAAYSLGSRTREGQTFAADISIVKIDYETGLASQVAALGFDRETDDSEDGIGYSLEAVAGTSAVVLTRMFGENDATYRIFDVETGEETASFSNPEYSFESSTGSCRGGVSNLTGLSDGRLAGTSLGSPAFVDLESGEISLVIACDAEQPELGDFVAVAAANNYVVFNQGPTPSAEDIDWLLTAELEPDEGFVEGDGDLWWINVDPRSVNETQAIVGGVVQFDMATQQVEAVHPLRGHLGSYLDCASGGDSCEIQTISQAQLRYFDGRLVIVDINENGNVLVLNPADSSIVVTELERGEGVDYTAAELLAGDPNGIWLDVKRMTITQDDDSGRFASGPSYIEHLNPLSGLVDLSLNSEDIF